MKARFFSLLAFYRRRSFWGYWIWALLAVVLGMVVGETWSENLVWIGLRYQAYGFFQSLGPRAATPKWTALVLVDDDEYWKGELARRSPIRRDYLAKLLNAASVCHPIAVAIDFDLRSPAPDLRENPAYRGETDLLRQAIVRTSARFPVVLPVSLLPGKSGLEPSILDGIPSRGHAVVRGYIAMPYDFRRVPTTERLGNGQDAPSLALALVGEANPRIARQYEHEPGEYPFGTFAKPAAFVPYIVASSYLLHGGTGVCTAIDHKLVILGGAWHRAGYLQGELIDTHDSSIGPVGKFLLHANYVESMMEERTYSSLPAVLSRAVEILFALVVLHVLAGAWPMAGKFAIVVATTGLLALITYFGLQNLGVFGDFLFPAFFLFLHAIVDYIWHLISISKEFKAMQAEKKHS